MSSKNDLFFIQEESTQSKIDLLSEDEAFGYGIKILEENKRKGIKGGTLFKAIMQEANVVNQNKRSYMKDAISGAITEQSPKIDSGIFFGEMDHPLASDGQRFSRVELKNSCFRVLKFEWDGDKVYGIGETLANTPGKDMQALMVENGIDLGFSLRAMGQAKPNPKTGIIEVHAPMHMICYDCVSNPSHKNARVSKILENDLGVLARTQSQMDSLMENEMNLQAICESYGFDLESLIKNEDIIVTPDNGMAIVKINNSIIKTYLQEDTVSRFMNVKKKYFV